MYGLPCAPAPSCLVPLCYTDRLVSAPFTINPQNGHLSFPDLPLDLWPQIPQSDFIASTARLNRDNLGSNDGWQRYSVKAMIPEDRKLGIFLIFWNGCLSKTSFTWSQKDEGWDTWSEEGEKARQAEYQRELESQLGARLAFPWGKVSAILDARSGGTDIWVDYSCSD